MGSIWKGGKRATRIVRRWCWPSSQRGKTAHLPFVFCRSPIRRRPTPLRRSNFHRLRSDDRSEEHTSELQSLMRISYAVFCLKKKKKDSKQTKHMTINKR